MRQSLQAADEIVDPPRVASGALHRAGPADRERLISWVTAFSREALGIDDPRAPESVAGGLRRGEWLVWEDGGEPVSLVRANARVADVVRIGPVYTPPQWRRRGYAGTAVAAASRRAFEAGARRCAIIADHANHTSNRIYSDVGYRPIMDLDEYTFSCS